MDLVQMAQLSLDNAVLAVAEGEVVRLLTTFTERQGDLAFPEKRKQI